MNQETSSTPPPLRSAHIQRSPASERRKGSRGWMIVALILAFLLAMTWTSQIATSFTLGSSGYHDAGASLNELLVEDNGSPNKILKIEINGTISSDPADNSGGNLVDFVDAQFELAEENPDIYAVILSINSPGGEVLASDEIYRRIKEFQNNTGKPVVAAMNSLAASGGYYIAAPCEWIVANELTLTGSIGVIMSGINYRGLMDKVGVEPLVFKSGQFKDMLSSTKSVEEITAEEKALVQDLVDETYQRFVQIVQEGREAAFELNGESGAKALAENWTEFADGRIFSGKQGLENGFVDELGNFEVAFDRTLSLAEIEHANLIQYERPVSFSSLFRIFGETEASTTIKVDLGLDLPELKMGRMYFLPGALIQPTY